MPLKPVNLVQAATADLKRRRDNKARAEGELSSPMEHYAFLGQHVRVARGERHLLRLAYNYVRRRAVKSQKKSTRLIYSDLALLFEALLLTKEEKDGNGTSTWRRSGEAPKGDGGN